MPAAPSGTNTPPGSDAETSSDEEPPEAEMKTPVTPMQLVEQSHRIMKYVKKLTNSIERSEDARELREMFVRFQQISKGIIPARNRLDVTLTPFHDNLIRHMRGIHAALLMDTERRVPSSTIAIMSGGGLCGQSNDVFNGGGETIDHTSKDPLDYHLTFGGYDDRPASHPDLLTDNVETSMSGGGKSSSKKTLRDTGINDPQMNRAIDMFNKSMSGGIV